MNSIEETKKELMEFGFKFADAENAAKATNGDLHEALYYLYNNMIKIKLKMNEPQPINTNAYQNNYNRPINNNQMYINNNNNNVPNNFTNNQQYTNISNNSNILNNNPYINNNNISNTNISNNNITNTNISNNNNANNNISNNNNNPLDNSNSSSKTNTRYNNLSASINNNTANNENLNSKQNQITTSNSKINQKPNDTSMKSEDEDKMLASIEKDLLGSDISSKNPIISTSINKSNNPITGSTGVRRQISYTREENVAAFIKSIKDAYPPSINKYLLIDCFKTLKVILQNIVNHPNEEKYCKIKTTNKVFVEKVSKINLAMNIIYEMGFHKENENEVLVLNKEDQDFELFNTIIKNLDDELTILEA